MVEKTVIEASKSKGLSLRELLQYRDLFVILAWRDLRVRYAQTILGLLWALLQPLVTLLIFIVIFGRALNVETGEIPYPLFALSGMAAWSYFSFVLQQSGSSLINAQEMVKKIYFPRLIIPLSKSVTGFVDLLVTLIFLLILMSYYGFPPGWNLLYFPAALIAVVIVSLGAGIWTSALTIRFRDVQHIIPFIVQVGLYATPIAYPSSLIPEKWLSLYYLNPMTGVVDIFRYSLLGEPVRWELVGISLVAGLIIFITGTIYFKSMEKVISDVV